MVTFSERLKNVNLFDKIRRYFAFSKEEVKTVIISILILGFVDGFNDGRNTFNAVFWIQNMIGSILIVALAFLVHQSAQRISALSTGFQAEYKIWWYGLIGALIVAIISNGSIWLIIPGTFICTMLERHRLGKFRYRLNYWALGWISFSGTVANIMLAFFFKALLAIPLFSNNILLEKAIYVNIAFACFSMLPFPNLDGLYIFFASRPTYVFTYGCIIGASLLLAFISNIFLILLGALLVGGAMWLIYYLSFEKGAWKPFG